MDEDANSGNEAAPGTGSVAADQPSAAAEALPPRSVAEGPQPSGHPHLIFSPPDWLTEKHGSDVLSGMAWLPFVTFWQVTADPPFATGVPPGHGHTYTSEYVDGWNTVSRPVGITGHELAGLRNIVADDQ